MIAVVDYGMGNRRSVHKALAHVGAEVETTGDRARLAAASGLVLPGVGAFPAGMTSLAERGLVEPVRAAAAEGRPVLGICLGMQLLFEGSTELGGADGLGLLAGGVTRLQADALRIPHIGWNDVTLLRETPLTVGLGEGAAFYHVHSYAARPARGADVIATTTYGETFATIVGRGHVTGVQFHPEKSSVDGLAMLRAWTRMCASVPAPARA